MLRAMRHGLDVTTPPHPSRFTADAFLAWAVEQPRGRYELVGGEVVAMAPERVGHARLKLAAVKCAWPQAISGEEPPV